MSYRFFQNSDCEYFPCHKLVTNGADRLDYSKFSCLFCFCPLYSSTNCGGQYRILDNGWKDCSDCILPHYNYDYIIQKLRGDSRLKKFDDSEIIKFNEQVQDKLPKYIISSVSNNEDSGYLKVSLQFPDSGKISYMYQVRNDTDLNDELASHCIRCCVDIAMTNLNNHLRMLQILKDNL